LATSAVVSTPDLTPLANSVAALDPTDVAFFKVCPV